MRSGRTLSSLSHATTPSRYCLCLESSWPRKSRLRRQSTDTKTHINNASSTDPVLSSTSSPSADGSHTQKSPKTYNNNGPPRSWRRASSGDRASIFPLRYQPMGSSTQWLQEYISSSGVDPSLDHWRLIMKKSDLYRLPISRKEFDDIINGKDITGVPNWSTRSIHARVKDLQRMKSIGIIEKKPYILTVTGAETQEETQVIKEHSNMSSLYPPIKEDDINFEALFETIIGLKTRYILHMLGRPELKRLRNEYVHNLVKFGLDDGILGVKQDGTIFVGQVKFLKRLEILGFDKEILKYYTVDRETNEIKFDFLTAKREIKDYVIETKPVSPQLQKIIQNVAGEEEDLELDKSLLAKEARYYLESVKGIQTIPERNEDAPPEQPSPSKGSSLDSTTDKFEESGASPKNQTETQLDDGSGELTQHTISESEARDISTNPPSITEAFVENSPVIAESSEPIQKPYPSASQPEINDDVSEPTKETSDPSPDSDTIYEDGGLEYEDEDIGLGQYHQRASVTKPTSPKRAKPKKDDLLEDLQEAFSSPMNNQHPRGTTPHSKISSSSAPSPFVDDGYEYLRQSLNATSQVQEDQDRENEDEESDSDSDSDDESDEEEESSSPRRFP